MAKVRVEGSGDSKKRSRPALTPDARENQLISLAMDLAEKQLLDGSASSQVITHFLKAGTAKTELEKEKIVQENLMLKAKTESLQSAKHVEELYEEAIKAMRNYGGKGDEDDY